MFDMTVEKCNIDLNTVITNNNIICNKCNNTISEIAAKNKDNYFVIIHIYVLSNVFSIIICKNCYINFTNQIITEFSKILEA